MTLTLTAGAYPCFVRGNYLTREADEQGDLVVSAGNSYRHRLYDNDPAATWPGTASDATPDTITFGVWDPGVQTAKDIDFIALLGHNLASFLIDLSATNGATYAAANYSATGQTADYYIKNVATAISADKLRVTAQTAQTVNAQKLIGSIIVGAVALQAPIGLSTYKQRPARMKAKEARMYDGSVRRSHIYRSDASLSFWGALCGFTGLTETQADSLEAVLLGADPFFFAPRPGDQPDFWKFCQLVPNTYTRDYAYRSANVGALAVSFELEEVGGS